MTDRGATLEVSSSAVGVSFLGRAREDAAGSCGAPEAVAARGGACCQWLAPPLALRASGLLPRRSGKLPPSTHRSHRRRWPRWPRGSGGGS
eukprot:scaffold47582_cov50-Phaeocystis_antarctica.AAC.2